MPNLPQPRLSLVYSLQMRAEPGPGTVLHSLFLTFTDFASTLQLHSASYLPLLLGSNSFKTPLNPKVLFTTIAGVCGWQSQARVALVSPAGWGEEKLTPG